MINVFGKEEFKPLRKYGKIIPNYFVSKDGKVVSRRTTTEKVLNPHFYKTGLKYGSFIVSIDEDTHKELFPNDTYEYAVGATGGKRRRGKKKSILRKLLVHQAVMWSWKPIDDYPPVPMEEWEQTPESVKDIIRKSICIDHIDGDSSNNHIDNLLYTSQAGNNFYRKRQMDT